MIQKIIHQIWIGPNEMPEKCKDYINSVKEHNKDYEHILWTNETIPDLPEKVKIQFDKYGNKKKWAFQADVLRYFLINKYGGVYMDADFQCFQHLPDITNTTMFFCKPNLCGHWITNCIFGSVKDNPFFEKILSEMKHEPYHGPIFLSNELKKFYNLKIGKATSLLDFGNILTQNGIKVFEPIYFFSKNPKHNRYAYHHAHGSWIQRKK